MQPDQRGAHNGRDASAANRALSLEPLQVRDADKLAVLVREIAEPAAVPLARAVLTRFAERENASEGVRSALALAVTEACSNVVLHAYVDADAPGYVEVSAGRANGALVVEVRDDGRGMTPRIDSPGLGVGLALIAQMADAFEIRTRASGLVLSMRFNLSPAVAA
jgi:anti-sigma regulatory factor (Ser/Thr protein kinase)